MTTELIFAAEAGDISKLKTLISGGVELNQRDSRGRTAAMTATHANQVEAVRLLIGAGADIDIQDNLQDNVFLYAGAEGLLEILKLAVEAGASTVLTNRYGGSALIPAAERGHIEVVREILTSTDVHVDHVNRLGWTALLEAIILTDGGSKHQEIVRLLIEHGANVNLPDGDGVPPITHARSRGMDEIMRLLTEAGAE